MSVAFLLSYTCTSRKNEGRKEKGILQNGPVTKTIHVEQTTVISETTQDIPCDTFGNPMSQSQVCEYWKEQPFFSCSFFTARCSASAASAISESDLGPFRNIRLSTIWCVISLQFQNEYSDSTYHIVPTTPWNPANTSEAAMCITSSGLFPSPLAV